MLLFMLACFDRPNSLDSRMATREAHLAYVRERLNQVKVAGPMLDEADGMAGSLFVLDVPDRAAAQAFHDADLYKLAGLFGNVELRGFKATVGSL